MSEAHDLAAGFELRREVVLHAIERTDLLDHAQHRLVRVAVQGTLERPDCRHHGRIQTRERARGDARRERRGVEIVMGV
jgi:hypothetical protein